ncbi:MHYT domain-containing protein [Thauera linaloolentis]|uniref:Sensor protein FixL n=1 Tax=Thauera linaloolentis (strain DSM 12138 / JCM 21573 / CCUG 41526 / CIP 105981 / IAM 15112 / NBRC 102519 / 47Lol) TaxID=1123367 RepID=N6YU55_THAL4|nr:MHYT domain-containing protein [Thauera linaloolentis]ENO85703.1 Response regulator receiver [Thauera linaloolentis 47Lol = DSM 12138]MCM8566674.1 ATP-binding protein [Thauera linaloolentis]
MEAASFFVDTAAHASYLHGTHHPGLVLLSIFVSIFSATMALQTAQIARRTESALYRHIAIGTGAIALGGGIWTMHFIGMLAFELPTRVDYATRLTLLSLLPACAASWFALRILAQSHVTRWQFTLSGTLVGLGIGTMHYSGMAAMQTPLQMRYEPFTFALSIVVAIGLAILALWVRYGLKHTTLGRLQRFFASGAVMGLAIAGMHYTGMAAVRFIGEAGEAQAGVMLNTTYASLVLSSFTITVTVLVAAVNGLIRSREIYLKLDEGQSRLRATLDTAVDGIITIDSRGLIQGYNQSAERLFGWTAEEVVGRNIKMLMPEPDQSKHDGYLHNYLSSGKPKIIGTGREVTGLRKDGSLMPMRLAVGRVELPGELLFVGFVSDISERHALEASLRETAERAEQAAAAKSTFLANMSHEIRTPMNAIIGFTELLLQSDLTPIQRSHLNTISQSSRSLLGLINDILDTTKMEKGRLELEHADFSLKGLTMQIESSLRLGAQAKHLTLATHYPPEMPEFFRGDPLRLLQILTNLIGNAIKFTERGRIDVVFSYDEDIVHVQVRDTGIGMTRKQVDSVFAPFTQADASISRRFGGTGLGTSIARQLVELMGGRIEVESTLGHGSTFHIRLPLPLGRAPETLSLDVPHHALPPLRMLIADDVQQNLELLALTLEGNGHRVDMARDGDEAVAKFVDGRFDVILMDVHMPGTDGLQAARLIRQYERTHERVSVPIVALTASVMADDRRAALEAGMNGFAVKPLDLPRLFDEIAKVLSIPPPTVSAAVPDGEIPRPLIDWPTGIALWGSEARLIASLRQFLDTANERYPLPDEGSSDIDWDKTQFNLHGLRGVAGNLALPAVAEMARSAESLVREGRHDDAQPKFAALRTLLAAAWQELLDRADTAPTPDLAPPASPQPDLLPALLRLLDVIEHNEMDDGTLDTVCLGLERQGERSRAHSLRTAVESFEFRQAHTQLKQFIAERSSGTPS